MRKTGTCSLALIQPEDGILVSIDPGRIAVGVAVFRKRSLIACGMARSKEGEGPLRWINTASATVDLLYSLLPGSHREGLAIDTLAIELMETRAGRSDAHADLIELSQVSGALWASLPWTRGAAVLPGWTGGRNKTINGQRIRSRLDTAETSVLEKGLYGVPASHVKEVVDAIGIGLFVNQRL